MSKQNLIGFFLIWVILLFSLFYQYQRTGKGKTDTARKEGVDTLVGEIIPGVIPSRQMAAAQQSIILQPDTGRIEEKRIVVRTDLWEATFSNRGGDITSFKLFEYEDPEGKPVELIPQEERYPFLSLAVQLSHGAFIVADSLFFDVNTDEERIILGGEDSTAELTFSTTLPNGVGLMRRYEFSLGSYRIKNHTLVVAPENQRIDRATFALPKGIRPSEKRIARSAKDFKSFIFYGDELIRKGIKDPAKSVSYDGDVSFIGVNSKYFAFIVAPENLIAAGGKLSGQEYEVNLYGEKARISRPQSALFFTPLANFFECNLSLYLGPQDYSRLKGYGRKFEEVVNLGWRWIRPLSLIFLRFFTFLYSLLHNYGVVIILFALLIKLLLYPLNYKMLHSMRGMRELEPYIKELRKQYKNDPQRLNLEVMKLYKKHGVNPLGGCLPMLFQLPIFIALFQVLSFTIALRASPFVFWIKDLSQLDPYRILPIIMTLAQFIQQRLTVTDPKQKAMTFILPLVFFFIFMNFPAGLVLYWTVFNIFALVEHYIFNKRYKAKAIVK